ncbi:MAG: hypothetical protein PQJ50_04335, partial [Spirochaetales bacterium]|nr:hypothetical protein [Spirochaetales bacterium]
TVRVLLNARLKDGSEEDVFIVPLSALFSNPAGESQVWILDESDMTVSSRAVETGTISDDYINITSGIESGETIVTAGVSQLMEGQTVRYYNQ